MIWLCVSVKCGVFDWIDGSWLGISNKDGEHNQVTYRVVEPVNKSELLAQYVMSLD